MKKIYLQILMRCAKYWLRKHSPYVIGVTGSMGKTTCRTVVSGVLKDMFVGDVVHTPQHNRNTEIGMVCSIFQQSSYSGTIRDALMLVFRVVYACLFTRPSYGVLVLEYGIDAPGDMDILLDIAVPHMALFTGFDIVHSEQFSSVDHLLQEKMKLLQCAQEIVFVPVKSDYVHVYLQDVSSDVLTFAFDEVGIADIGFSGYEVVCSKDIFPTSVYTVTQGVDDAWIVHSNLFGKEYATYVSLGIEIAMIIENRLGYSLQKTSDEVYTHNHEQFPGRGTLFRGICGSILLDATYNASPKSMQHIIEKAVQLRTLCYSDYDIIYCLGDMHELGDMTSQAHRGFAARISQSADEVYLVGNAMHTHMYDELIKLGYNEQHIHLMKNAQDCGVEIKNILPGREHCSLVVMKGSQDGIFMEEALVPLLKNKGDLKNVCRQSKSWSIKKEKYFAQSAKD